MADKLNLRQNTLAKIRDEVFRDDPKGWQAYLNSAPRAELAAKLKKRRRCAKLSIGELATKAKMKRNEIGCLESATTPWPDMNTIRIYLSTCKRERDRNKTPQYIEP